MIVATLPELDQKGINRLFYNILLLDALIGMLSYGLVHKFIPLVKDTN